MRSFVRRGESLAPAVRDGLAGEDDLPVRTTCRPLQRLARGFVSALTEAGFGATARACVSLCHRPRAGLGDFRLFLHTRRGRADKAAEQAEQRETVAVLFGGTHQAILRSTSLRLLPIAGRDEKESFPCA